MKGRKESSVPNNWDWFFLSISNLDYMHNLSESHGWVGSQEGLSWLPLSLVLSTKLLTTLQFCFYQSYQLPLNCVICTDISTVHNNTPKYRVLHSLFHIRSVHSGRATERFLLRPAFALGRTAVPLRQNEGWGVCFSRSEIPILQMVMGARSGLP